MIDESDLNAFERYRDAQKPRFERRREAAIAKRKATLKARQEEKRALATEYRLISEHRRKELLAGPLGAEFQALIDYLERLTLRDGAELIAFVCTLKWIAHAPADLRYEVLHLISRRVIALREGAGMSPFDDGLPWDVVEPVFVRVRSIIDDQGSAGGLCQGPGEALAT